jgi:gamma-glutamyltranspeptidase/glutathione hydrolase
MSAQDPDFVHVVTECAKLAFADREAFYGDPDFVTVPTDTLLGDAYNDARRKLVSDDASLEIRPGEIAGHGGKVVVREKGTTESLGALGAGEPTVKRFDESEVRGDTVHFDIIDRHGNMVSATPSGGWLQSSPVVEGLGFCLTSRAQMFWLEEGLPASLEPCKRPRTTLTPSLALRDGTPYMVFGTPGGDQQDQWCLHLFLRHVHFGMNLQESIDAPGFQTEHFPGSFYPRECDLGHLALEGRFPDATRKELEGRGHRVQIDEDWALGRMTAAAKDGSMLKAGANPRFMQGYAIGR